MTFPTKPAGERAMRDKTEEWDFAHTERAMRDQGFTGLTALVQYREHGKLYWRNMAAFDSLSAAESYVAQCARPDSAFEYQAIEYFAWKEAITS